MADTSLGAVPVALALLDRAWPPVAALVDVGAGPVRLAALRDDPRYLAGRLAQALAVLLAADLPPADHPTALLCQAMADAIAYRQHAGRDCPRCADSLCKVCAADWGQVDRYHLLALMLGAVGDIPATPAEAGAASVPPAASSC